MDCCRRAVAGRRKIVDLDWRRRQALAERYRALAERETGPASHVPDVLSDSLVLVDAETLDQLTAHLFKEVTCIGGARLREAGNAATLHERHARWKVATLPVPSQSPQPFQPASA